MTDQQYPTPADDALRVVRPAWHMAAGCRAIDNPEIFFSDLPDDVDAAKTICSSCPVARGCFLWAMRTLEPHGIWGGYTAAERDEIRRSRAS